MLTHRTANRAVAQAPGETPRLASSPRQVASEAAIDLLAAADGGMDAARSSDKSRRYRTKGGRNEFGDFRADSRKFGNAMDLHPRLITNNFG